jgi:hypothetical protein
MATTSIAGPGAGFKYANTDFQMICTPGCSKGDIMAIDVSLLNTRNGVEMEVWDTMVVPASADDTAEGVDALIAGVALEDIAAGAKGMFRFRGIVDVRGGATVAKGAAFGCAATKFSAAGADTLKTIGFAITAHTNAAAPLYRSVFNGIEGFEGKFG